MLQDIFLKPYIVHMGLEASCIYNVFDLLLHTEYLMCTSTHIQICKTMFQIETFTISVDQNTHVIRYITNIPS